MHGGQASSSEASEQDHSQQGRFIVHKVSRSDNLAGLAIRYHVSVSDIKRANGLLSDTAMFAKDTVLIPTQALPINLEHATWASMIVTQYGRLNTTDPRAHFGNMPASTTAALDQLQQYYGIADSAPEPGDFRPGPARGSDSEAGDVELTTLDLNGSDRAVTAEGLPFDKRLRRRKADESPSRFGSSSSLAAYDSGTDDAAAPGGIASPGRPPLHLPRSRTPPPVPPGVTMNSLPLPRAIARPSNPPAIPPAAAGTARKETFLDKIKRAASQPALAVPPNQPSLAKMGDAAVASLTVASRTPSENGGTTLQKVASAVNLKREKEASKKA